MVKGIFCQSEDHFTEKQVQILHVNKYTEHIELEEKCEFYKYAHYFSLFIYCYIYIFYPLFSIFICLISYHLKFVLYAF